MIPPALGTACERQINLLYLQTYLYRQQPLRINIVLADCSASEWTYKFPSICEWPDQKVDQVLQTGLYWCRQWLLITSPGIHHTQKCSRISSIWFLSWAPQFPPTTHPSPSPSQPLSWLAPCITKPNPGRELLSSSQYEDQYDKSSFLDRKNCFNSNIILLYAIATCTCTGRPQY